jgi:hypothetical protein
MIHSGHVVHPEIWTLWANQALTVLNTIVIVFILLRRKR